MLHKRKFSLILCLLMTIFLFGCGGQTIIHEIEKIDDDLFSVHFLNVGQGDCTFISLPDGKNVLIDTGEADRLNENRQCIINYLNAYDVQTIDYLILTHPDSDHVGNAEYIINNFEIKNAFIPYVLGALRPNYYYFERAYTALEQEGANVIISDCYRYVKGENYAYAFLSPKPKDMLDSSYSDFNGMLVPNEQASNDLSPIIYFEAFNKRFIFTGDAGKKQENMVLQNYSIGLYDTIFARHGISVILEEIDCLKVGHHGSDSSSGVNFINLLSPKNAVISVGGNNYYGHPSTKTLESLERANPNYTLYRTDYHGTIVFRYNSEESCFITFT